MFSASFFSTVPSPETSPDHIMRTMVKMLNMREDEWTKEQKKTAKIKDRTENGIGKEANRLCQ